MIIGLCTFPLRTGRITFLLLGAGPAAVASPAAAAAAATK